MGQSYCMGYFYDEPKRGDGYTISAPMFCICGGMLKRTLGKGHC